MKKAVSVLLILLLAAAFSAGAFAAGPDTPVAHKLDYDAGIAYVDLPPAQQGGDEPRSMDGGGENPDVPANVPSDVSGASALFNEWEMNGYPDDIGGVYFDSGTGRLAVLLVNGSEARKEELRALAGDPELSFTESAYSYNELRAVLDEITKEMSAGAEGLYGAGIGWTSRDGQVTGFGESGKEFRVTVTVDKSVLDQYTGDFAARYGDKVHVEAGEMAVPLTDSAAEIGAQALIGGTAKSGLGRLLPEDILLLAGLAALGALLIFLFLRRARLVARTTTGGTVTASRSMSRRAVEEAVKESALSPSDEAYEKLMERLK